VVLSVVPTISLRSDARGILSLCPPEEHYGRSEFPNMATIEENVTAVMRSIPTEALPDTSHKVYEVFQTFVLKYGDDF
jgi:hypothetical protein